MQHITRHKEIKQTEVELSEKIKTYRQKRLYSWSKIYCYFNRSLHSFCSSRSLWNKSTKQMAEGGRAHCLLLTLERLLVQAFPLLGCNTCTHTTCPVLKLYGWVWQNASYFLEHITGIYSEGGIKVREPRQAKEGDIHIELYDNRVDFLSCVCRCEIVLRLHCHYETKTATHECRQVIMGSWFEFILLVVHCGIM